MAIGALYGYKGSNGRAMDMWEQGEQTSVLSFWVAQVEITPVYAGHPTPPPLTMLTDTFTAQAFFTDFISDPTRALRWGTLRQDSGDPRTFVRQAKEAWKEVEEQAGVKRDDGKVAVGKRIIFSDGLDVDKAVELQTLCDELDMAGTSLV